VEDEPVPPGQLNRQVPRDLETICLKCLHKEAGRRYATAAALADDLGRLLQGQPIQARPVGAVGRWWRWCRRRPAVAGLTAALMLALVGGSLTSFYLLHRAVAGEQQARDHLGQAEAARRLAEEQEQETLEILGESVRLNVQYGYPQSSAERSAERLNFLSRAEERYRALLSKQPGNLRLQWGLAEVYLTRGTLRFQGGQRNLAEQDLEKARVFWEELERADGSNRHFRSRLASTHSCLGSSYAARGRPAQALSALEEASRRIRILNAEQPTIEGQLLAWTNEEVLARVLASAGRQEESRRVLDALSVSMSQLTVPPMTPASPSDSGRQSDGSPAAVRQAADRPTGSGADPSREVAVRAGLARQLIVVCIHLRSAGEHAQAVRVAENAVRLLKELRDAEPDQLDHRLDLSEAWHWLGKFRWNLGQSDPALDALRQAVAEQRHVFEQAPAVYDHRLALSKRYDALVHFLLASGKLAEAETCFLAHEKLWPADPERLREVSRDLGRLAAAVGGGREQLTATEQAERQRYREQSERVARKAEALAPRGNKRAE
jgi:tetratricopeptide (TPR) repeat protein